MGKPTLRLLMIIDKFEVGGTETYVSAVVEEMVKRGVSIYVAGKRGSLLSKFRALGCPIFTKINDSGPTLHGWPRTFMRAKEFKKVMKDVGAEYEMWSYRDKWGGAILIEKR